MPTPRCSFVSILWCWQLWLNILLPVSNELLAVQEAAKKQSSECQLIIFCDALPKVPILRHSAHRWHLSELLLNSSEVCYFIFRWVFVKTVTGFPVSEFPTPSFLVPSWRCIHWAGSIQEFHCPREIRFNHKFRKFMAFTLEFEDQRSRLLK